MYLNYWGFQAFPFDNVPDPDFFYLSKSHEEALARLIYVAEMRKGGGMLSGEIGCGKTTLSKVYLQELSSDRFDIAIIINPKLGPKEFLQEVLYQFGMNDVPDSKVECLRILGRRMIGNLRDNRETLLLIDEAQLLYWSTLEEIRLLLNFQLNNRFLITVILIGQPELRDKIQKMEQLNQRISVNYHITPFHFEDTVKYIFYRQKKAGRVKNIFSFEAIRKIFDYSQGVPRKINNLCDLSLLTGFNKKEKLVDSKLVENIIIDGALF